PAPRAAALRPGLATHQRLHLRGAFQPRRRGTFDLQRTTVSDELLPYGARRRAFPRVPPGHLCGAPGGGVAPPAADPEEAGTPSTGRRGGVRGGGLALAHQQKNLQPLLRPYLHVLADVHRPLAVADSGATRRSFSGRPALGRRALPPRGHVWLVPGTAI